MCRSLWTNAKGKWKKICPAFSCVKVWNTDHIGQFIHLCCQSHCTICKTGMQWVPVLAEPHFPLHSHNSPMVAICIRETAYDKRMHWVFFCQWMLVHGSKAVSMNETITETIWNISLTNETHDVYCFVHVYLPFNPWTTRRICLQEEREWIYEFCSKRVITKNLHAIVKRTAWNRL